MRISNAIAWIAALAITAATLAPATAHADGDPASDVLIAASVFYPFSPAVSAGLQHTLDAEAAAARRAHFPIKVALIASPTDLGAIPSLFAKPQQYADFLDQEISFAGTRTLLLVVMPNGYGVQGLPRAATVAVASLAKPRGRRSNDLAQAAIVAVPKLAAAAGDPLTVVPGAPTANGGGGGGAAEAGALAVVAVIATAAVVWFRRRRAQTR